MIGKLDGCSACGTTEKGGAAFFLFIGQSFYADKKNEKTCKLGIYDSYTFLKGESVMKIIVLKKRAAGILAGILALGMVVYVIAYPSLAGAYPADRPLPIYCVDTTQKVCAISFDAAWGDVSTKDLVDILNQYHVKATFFVIGKWAKQYPDDVKMLAKNDMEVMSHSYAHDHMPELSTQKITEDLQKCNKIIKKLTGASPTLFRCPYGDYDTHVINAVRSTGMEPIQWSVDSLDWKGISAAKITQRVMSDVCPGAIILFHNAAKHTPEALPGILEQLLTQGYKIVPVSQLIIKGKYNVNYTIDHTGKQIAKQKGTAQKDALQKNAAQKKSSQNS